MGKHHTEDYKLSAVKHALRIGNQKVKPKNYENYYLHAFRAEWLRKTRRQKLKEYQGL